MRVPAHKRSCTRWELQVSKKATTKRVTNVVCCINKNQSLLPTLDYARGLTANTTAGCEAYVNIHRFAFVGISPSKTA